MQISGTRGCPQKGWNIQHPSKGGNFLEEQEIEDYFGAIGLNRSKPDFLICNNFSPLIVVEAKKSHNQKLWIA